MAAAGRLQPLDWQSYLEREERAERKHEYVGGYVYAMADATGAHNLIASNVLIALARRLGSFRCRAFNPDMKVRMRTEEGVRFYYPDCSVICGPFDPDAVFAESPTIVVEVFSSSTRRIDQCEKRRGYMTIPSLAVYLLVDSERAEAALWRRSGAEFTHEVFVDPSASIPLPEIGLSLPIVELYANVKWTPPEKDE